MKRLASRSGSGTTSGNASSFESMSIGTQFSDSSNKANIYPPYVMSYGQPSSWRIWYA